MEPFAKARGAAGLQFIRPYREHGTRQHLEYALPNALLVGYPAMAQNHAQCFRIDCRTKAGKGQQSLEFRREEESSVDDRDVKRLLAQTIADRGAEHGPCGPRDQARTHLQIVAE